jgi:N-acetylmuramic acid 6-phosphate etherase
LQLKELKTELRNPASENLDTMTALELATALNQADMTVPHVIQQVLPQIALAIDAIAQRFAQGGRLIYVGTGTSGRIGALDSSECPPTFGTDPNMVQFLIAGGETALAHAAEASEDSAELGRTDMAAKQPGENDAVVGLAASGRTPYTIGALQYAREQGAIAIAIACNTGSELAKAAEISIEVDVGPEILTGSTRLKAGTAQKLVCNMLTTGAMAQLGYVYSNLMVNLHLKNEKLIERGISIVQTLAQVERTVALETLQAADLRVPLALVMLKAQVDATEAANRLRDANGNVRKALLR